MSKAIVLGAKGRFGRAAVTAFAEAGWEVTAFGRNWKGDTPKGVSRVTGDAKDAAALRVACTGQDLIVNAVNPLYPDWKRDLPLLTAATIAAAKHSGATVLIPGNLYNYGEHAPAALQEDTAWQPSSRKGHLRVAMEMAYRTAGVPTIVLRAGDYIEHEKSGNWFDAQITKDAHKGRTVYPGPLDLIHSWAYLPDVARAAVLLAEKRDIFSPFEEFGFEGYTLTGAELVDHIGKAVGKPQKTSGLPWFIIPVLGLFQPVIREVYEMRYLWHVPHRVVGTKLYRMFPDFKPTPIEDAMRLALAAS